MQTSDELHAICCKQTDLTEFKYNVRAILAFEYNQHRPAHTQRRVLNIQKYTRGEVVKSCRDKTLSLLIVFQIL